MDLLPALLAPMGVRSLRARTGREATEMIRLEPAHVAVVDLSLPLEVGPAGALEEAGARVLDLLSRLAQPPPTIIVKRARTHRDDARELAAALRAGAFAVIDRPRGQADLEVLLELLRRVLRRHYRDRWPAGMGEG
jgi:CheY-like chemotaxis protein